MSFIRLLAGMTIENSKTTKSSAIIFYFFFNSQS